jgi:crotonobetainyl-CoA:carnitine CoA-transferase CaiB-like acyl-CoA transferase
VTGLMGAFGIVSALHHRDDPEYDGELIDIALFEPLFRLVDWQVIVHDQLGQVPRRVGNQLAVAPGLVVNTYLTADGHWVTVTSGTPKSVRNVLHMLQLPVDEYMGAGARADAREELDRRLKGWIATRKLDEALREMRAIEVVAEKIHDMDDIASSRLYREREDIVEVEDPELGPVRMAAVIPKMRNNPGGIWRTGPRHGQDNDEVYTDILGKDAAAIAALRADGVI